MNKITLSLISLLALFLLTCQVESPDLGIAQKYLPDTQLLTEGIVNKYYTHYLPTDKQDISTDILYRSLQFSPSGSILSNNYNAAFQKTISREWSFENNQTSLLTEESYSYWGQDTFQHIVAKPVFRNWASNEAHLEKTIHYKRASRKWETEQLSLRDTNILEKRAIIFESKDSYTTYQNGDTIIGENPFYNKTIFVEGLGLYFKESKNNSGTSWTELVEQIPIKTFNNMANHGMERVAYIKPEDAIDQDTNFKLCGIHNYIFDYYNGGDLYGYKGGKRVIWDYMDEKLETEKLFKESGYLTFRFIVNCKGEAGRFVTEQADLDFQRKAFNAATIDHCYELLKGLKEWDPTHRDGEIVDAIFYFTFKLKDGELIDILPKF